MERVMERRNDPSNKNPSKEISDIDNVIRGSQRKCNESFHSDYNSAREITRPSYIGLLKQINETELVERRSQGTVKKSTKNRIDFSQAHGKTFKARRRSANAVTLVFGCRKSFSGAPRVVPNEETSEKDLNPSGSNSSDTQMHFSSRSTASEKSETLINLREARLRENSAKRRAKTLKSKVALARLDVAESKLVELTAKLEIRHAKLEERQAKLCRRKAALKKAEDEQYCLESKINDDVEKNVIRERRIKNRERHVKQIEAGLYLKEESLRKRELAVSQGIAKMEKWRKMVEEKEAMQKKMEEIVERKEELQGREKTTTVVGDPDRKKRINKKKGNLGDDITCFYRELDYQEENYRGFRPRVSEVFSVETKNNMERSAGNSVKGGLLSLWL